MQTNANSSESLNDLSFEQALAGLQRVVEELEQGNLGLEEAVARYEQGVRLLKHCYSLLRTAERKIDLLTGITEDGHPILEPLEDPDARASSEEPGRKQSIWPPQSEG